MTSVGPPDLPSEQSRTQGESLPDADALVAIRWIVDLGDRATVTDIGFYLTDLGHVIGAGEYLDQVLNGSSNRAALVLREIHYGSPLSVLLHAPKQLAEGVVHVLEFLVNIPADVRRHWAESREASAKAGVAERREEVAAYVADRIKAGRLKLTPEQALEFLRVADVPALQGVATTGQPSLQLFDPVTGKMLAQHFKF
jgi:hypothetical protein